jgi:hypothetical protein
VSQPGLAARAVLVQLAEEQAVHNRSGQDRPPDPHTRARESFEPELSQLQVVSSDQRQEHLDCARAGDVRQGARRKGLSPLAALAIEQTLQRWHR